MKHLLKDRLQEALDLRNMKPAELSRRTNISKSSISQYLKGTSIPANDYLFKLAKALNVSEAWLDGYDEVSMKRIEFFSTKTNFAEEVGRHIRKMMVDKNITIEQVATDSNKTVEEVQMMLDGKDRRFDKDLMWRFAEIMGEEPVVFFCKYYPVEDINKNMRIIREIADVDIDKVANYLEMPVEEYSNIEDGKFNPLFSTIEKFSDYFGIEPQQTICKNYEAVKDDKPTQIRLKAHAILSELTDEEKYKAFDFAEYMISRH